MWGMLDHLLSMGKVLSWALDATKETINSSPSPTEEKENIKGEFK